MGAQWAEATRGGFLRSEPRATRQALLACGPAALEDALKDLEAGSEKGT